MAFRRILFSFLTIGAAIAAAPSQRNSSFTWGSNKIRGVNIGGWLVLEPWITPSMFPASVGAVDEYTFCENLGPEEAHNRLVQHWESWVTYEDFGKIKDAGFNLIRIPIGFWAFKKFDTPFISGAQDYLDVAIYWAATLDLKVIIDIHGVPGSQNGFDNSGQRMETPQWLQNETYWQTLKVIEQVAIKYANPALEDVIVGIQILNEPTNWSLDVDNIRSFYRDGFNLVRQVSNNTVILSDAFLPPSWWNGFLTPSDDHAQNVAIDHHEYQVFNFEQIAWDPWQHRQGVCNNVESYNGADKWTFVGEWTAAMTDCALWLNGRYVPNRARYDGSYPNSTYIGTCYWKNNIELWPEYYKNDTRNYIEAQLDAYEAKTQGWIFWNFKTENAHEWDLFALLDYGIFPQPLDDRQFAPACTNL